ncbi:MAG: phosphoribosylformylglycinamidine synthase subunit PurQ [Candidatus Pelagibacter sp.]
MKSSVIIFPGSNCDRDMDVALKKFGFQNKMVWHNDDNLPQSDLIVLPGGFSYGDYLRCGSIAGKSKIISSVIDFAKSGGLVLGICNGFQILTETGLLPGVLQQNKNIEFICKNVFIKINDKENKYFKNIDKEVLELHIAHNEGNYFCSSDELKKLEDNNQIAVSYCNKDGNCDDYSNPNGAIKNIAGIFNNKKNILGMMPHPERMIDKYLSGEDGSLFFKNLFNNLKK